MHDCLIYQRFQLLFPEPLYYNAATVGLMLIHGYGCTQSQSDGVNWLKASALLGQPAQPGSIYGRGLLSRQYYNMKLFSKAAETALR